MSLEDAIRELTVAVKDQTARLDKMLGGAGAPATKAPAADKPAAKAPAAASKKTKEPTVDDIAAAAGEYLKSGKKDAKGNLTRICEHFGIDRLTNAKPDHVADILGMIKDFAAGREPEALDAGGDEEAEDDDSMI